MLLLTLACLFVLFLFYGVFLVSLFPGFLVCLRACLFIFVVAAGGREG